MAGGALTALDVYNVPLSGLNLIEASAGTGKTWTIAGLYVRLVAEAAIPVDRILVVTYTKAATEELRDRIRSRLVQVRQALEEGGSDDEFCRRLIQGWSDTESVRARLLGAIRGFDEAAIFTIHGFCQRALADSALESGVPFETELLADESELLLEVVEDFWRREVAAASSLETAAMVDEFGGPAGLAGRIRAYAGRPLLPVLAPQSADWSAAQLRYRSAFQAARASWRVDRERIETLLLEADGLNGSRYRKTSIPGWLARLELFLEPEEPGLPRFDKLEKFSARELAASVKKNGAPPEHPFFELCNALVDAAAELDAALGAYVADLRVRALHLCSEQLPVRKAQRRLQSYEDLLTALQRALVAPQGGELVRNLRSRYRATLIDEFQDTDPVQYDIFDRIYGDSSLPAFLVGDPKQAIYSFRGADIFAYLKAQAAARKRYTLDTNWRSTPELIRAVNTVFGAGAHPFVFEDIRFTGARAPSRETEPLLVDGEAGTALRMWFLSRGEDGKPLAKGKANGICAQATAAEIARLLEAGREGRARIGGDALSGGDIAVLVRSHTQGRMVRECLAGLGVPSVQRAQDNVFHSREAQEIERVLMAIAEPGREALVRAALVTEMLGRSAPDLDALSRNGADWEMQLERFHAYRELWLEHGFIRMFRQLLAEEQVPMRLLRYPDGERRLTNLLHLSELLHGYGRRRDAGMEGLLKWFADRRDEQSGEEETQLRLESDEDLVKIVTIHGSKGLQYPVVFCPFLWDGKLWSEQGDAVVFHDPAHDLEPRLDMGSAQLDAHRALAGREELAESIRLAYVALTRAKSRCYLAWGAVKQCETSALAWLFHRPAGSTVPTLAEVAARVRQAGDEALRGDLQAMVGDADDVIGISEAPSEDRAVLHETRTPAAALSARVFSHQLPPDWRVTSFSALASAADAERPDYDASSASESAPLSGTEFFAFPRGARAGQCLHTLLERLDFGKVDGRAETLALIARGLREYRFSEDWVPVLVDAFQRIVTTPLDDAGSLTLAGIASGRRLNEMEFYYPLGEITAQGLRRVLREHGFTAEPAVAEEMDRLAFSPVRGFMKGFIDLVFEQDGRYYLADYKSNWLGNHGNAYGPGQLAAAIGQHGYSLQYLIYTVALHRYLRRRVAGYSYERCFGGVYYLFLRGMDPERGNRTGVFHDRPAAALIEALDSYLDRGADHHGR